MLTSRGHLTYPEVRIHLIRILGGLKYLHKRGLIHRDLKPENLLFDKDMTLKIADFGLAVDLQSLCGQRPVRGTRRYIAPELLRKEKLYEQIADMYSVGVVM
jgi:serine/threonine protein kinase